MCSAGGGILSDLTDQPIYIYLFLYLLACLLILHAGCDGVVAVAHTEGGLDSTDPEAGKRINNWCETKDTLP